MTINEIVEKCIREELGAKTLEIIKLRAINSGQAAEIQRLLAELRMATEKGPELPLMKPAKTEGATNGAKH